MNKTQLLQLCESVRDEVKANAITAKRLGKLLYDIVSTNIVSDNVAEIDLSRSKRLIYDLPELESGYQEAVSVSTPIPFFPAQYLRMSFLSQEDQKIIANDVLFTYYIEDSTYIGSSGSYSFTITNVDGFCNITGIHQNDDSIIASSLQIELRTA